MGGHAAVGPSPQPEKKKPCRQTVLVRFEHTLTNVAAGLNGCTRTIAQVSGRLDQFGIDTLDVSH